jgi:hypothetical protein
MLLSCHGPGLYTDSLFYKFSHISNIKIAAITKYDMWNMIPHVLVDGHEHLGWSYGLVIMEAGSSRKVYRPSSSFLLISRKGCYRIFRVFISFSISFVVNSLLLLTVVFSILFCTLLFHFYLCSAISFSYVAFMVNISKFCSLVLSYPSLKILYL